MMATAHVEFVMGMAVSFDLRDEVDPAALVESIEWLHHVDATFSTHRLDSPISQFGLGQLPLDELLAGDLGEEIDEVFALCDVFRGEQQPGIPWSIGVRHPWEPEMSAAVLDLRGPCSIATSATYERGAHIVDPRDGEPTATVASMTIVGPDLTVVDVCATTAFVLGVDGLEWLLATHPECEGFVITLDGLTYETPGFDALRAKS